MITWENERCKTMAFERMKTMALDVNDHIVIPFDGDEHLFEVRYIFEPDDYEHSYIVVTAVGENEEDDSDEEEAFAFRFVEHGDGEDDLELFQIETEEEWDMIEEMLNTVQEMEE